VDCNLLKVLIKNGYNEYSWDNKKIIKKKIRNLIIKFFINSLYIILYYII